MRHGAALQTEGAVADGTHFADGESGVGRTALTRCGLGDEDGIAAAGIHPQDVREIRQVDIRAEDVDIGCGSTPDIVVLGLRAAGRIVAGVMVLRLDDPGVHEGRQGILGLAGGGHLVEIGSIVPGHEDLVGAVTHAEDLFPGAGSLAAALLPGLPGLGQEAVLVGAEPLDQLRGHGAGEGGIGGRAVIAGIAVQTHLILHLDHDDGLLDGIDLLDVLHQFGIGLGVGGDRLLTEGGEDGELLAFLGQRQGETVIVLLDPDRVVGTHAVLPAAEPQDAELEVTGAGGLDHLIDHGEVELALDGLDLLPLDHGEDGVHPALFEVVPERLHISRAGGGGIAEFAGEGEERFAPHDQLGHGAPFLEVGRLIGSPAHSPLRSRSAGREKGGGAKKKSKESIHGFVY